MLFRSAFALALLPLTSVGLPQSTLDGPRQSTEDLQALAGEWLYVMDRTAGRADEKQGPPMNVKFALRVEEDAVVFERGNGQEERIALDGSTTKTPEEGAVRHTRGLWKDGLLTYELRVISEADGALRTRIQREFRATEEGLMIRVLVGEPPIMDSTALYKHPDDIELPTPAPATIDDLGWLAGAWLGSRGTRAIEERWGPAAGGSMLGTSRTIRRERMVAFEYLRIVERDGTLVYVAQPGGRPPTEFVLTSLEGRRAVFQNPRHDSPQQIVYSSEDDGNMTATIGFVHGGAGTQFEFQRESR